MRDVSNVELRQRLEIDNPWWKTREVQAVYRRFIPRPYLDLLVPFVTQQEVNRAVVLLGPRRVGKTVLVHHVIQQLLDSGVDPLDIVYASADHPLFANATPDSIIQLYAQEIRQSDGAMPRYFFLDEAQYIRDWERYLKYLVDRNPDARFVVSGSAAAALRLKSIESGAGRFRDFLLPPLTFYEYLKMKGIDIWKEEDFNRPFLDYINYGGFPEISLAEVKPEQGVEYVKSDIIDKVLLRDLPSLYGVRDVQELNRLFTTLAYNTGGEVSLDGLAKRSGVSKATIKDYIEYLEAAFLIKRVRRIDRSGKYFQRENFFKVYLTNVSMYAALFGEVDAGSENMGQLVETAIYAQLFHDLTHHIAYARWKSGEIDLVQMNSNGDIIDATEIKWSDRYVHAPQGLTKLVDFCRVHNISKAVATSRSLESVIEIKNVLLHIFPAARLCEYLGFSMLRKKRVRKTPLGFLPDDIKNKMEMQ